VVEYGRRWYRTIIFSSDAAFTPHDMPIGFVPVGSGIKACGGDPKSLVVSVPSLLIVRDASVKQDKVQQFIPTRLLLGVMPSALLNLYNFWQNDDDSLVGFMPLKKNPSYARSILNVKPINDKKGMWQVSRSYIVEDPSVNELDMAFSVRHLQYLSELVCVYCA
jgi:hypothetical protein